MDSYDLPHFRSRTFREILPGVSVILPPKTGMWELGGYNGLNVFVPTLNKPYIILKEEMRVTRIPNQEISLDLTDFAIALGPSSICLLYTSSHLSPIYFNINVFADIILTRTIT